MRFAGCAEAGRGRVALIAPGEEIRRASDRIGSYSLRLDRDLSSYAVFDDGEPDGNRELTPESRWALLDDSNDIRLRFGSVPQTGRVIVFSGSSSLAAAWGSILGKGRVYAVGSRTGSPTLSKLLRDEQRFLPLTEVDPTVAVRSAVDESDSAPLWLCVHLGVLAPHLVPGVMPVAPGGMGLDGLRAALDAIPGHRVIGFEILGYPEPGHRNELIALTAAELLRDNILTWWPPEKFHV